MSTQYYAYVGPALVIQLKPIPKTVHHTEECTGCLEMTDKYPLNVVPVAAGEKKRFCQSCGGILSNFDLIEMVVPDCQEFFESIFDRIYEPQIDESSIRVLIPNGNPNQPRQEVESYGHFKDLSKVDKDLECVWFLTEFTKEFSECATHFGVQNVRVCWVFCNWAS